MSALVVAGIAIFFLLAIAGIFWFSTRKSKTKTPPSQDVKEEEKKEEEKKEEEKKEEKKTAPRPSGLYVKNYMRIDDTLFTYDPKLGFFNRMLNKAVKKGGLKRKDGENVEKFLKRCSNKCNDMREKYDKDKKKHVTCNIIELDGKDKCFFRGSTYNAKTKKYGDYKTEDNKNKTTKIFRFVGNTNDAICADYISKKHGTDWIPFRNSAHHSPASTYRKMCSGDSVPRSCSKAPKECKIKE